ncbi:MAG TPA: M20 family metallopeptidase [Sphingorhabdus sp.]|jgi:hippurate hydrolase|uniref:M20 metallopeptidase family protein n=1 Tax=Sphingorhabdus sp. TaxID=1902408 RepID=UPI002C9C5AB2|nr:M20 family metallopeptidase [Sphingorhabdus sp.]HMT42234.1 M20 family metallopeptidase [Sphingorhabdus sp.]HMU22574.1 M20 family metallopeptidase [Sphingorhabdus sp.]
MTLTDTPWRDDAESLLPDLVELRRAIHREPELGLQNPKTLAKIKAALAGLPLEFREGPSTTGLLAILRGPSNGRTVLLRGDMDALPLHEDTGLDFASETTGAMHACGHDTHVAMLVGAAKMLCARKEQLTGTVYFMFQPGEEGHHGARFMLDDGLLDPLPDAAFALHIMPNAPRGIFTGRSGPLLASSDVLSIKITGKGGHASMPHDAVDPIPVTCEIVSAIQTMVTRKVSVFDPAVITIAKIEAGTTNNIIPETANLLGTIRTLSPRRRAMVAEELHCLAPGIAAAHGCEAQVQIEQGFPVTLCDDRAVRFGQEVVEATFGTESWKTLDAPIMGAEDFAYVLEKVPGAMFFLGASHEGDDWRQCCGLHSNRMVLDESVMAKGAALHAAIAERFLAEGFDS